MEADVSRLESELFKLKEKHETITQEYDDLKEQKESMDVELNKLRKEKQESQQKETMQAMSLEGEVEMQSKRVQVLEQELSVLQEQLAKVSDIKYRLEEETT